MSWARTFLVGALVTLTGCVSSFEFAVDAQHPSRPEATGGSDLKAPSPFDTNLPKSEILMHLRSINRCMEVSDECDAYMHVVADRRGPGRCSYGMQRAERETSTRCCGSGPRESLREADTTQREPQKRFERSAKTVTDRDFFAVDTSFFLNLLFLAVSAALVGWHVVSNGLRVSVGKAWSERLLLGFAVVALAWLLGG